MIGKMLAFGGSLHRIGQGQGEALGEEIRNNIGGFWNVLESGGSRRAQVMRDAVAAEKLFSGERLDEISGIAEGAHLPYPEVLAYNLYHDLAFPEECTVTMALGSCTANGRTLFHKNSDKVGSTSYVGDLAYKGKEINVALLLHPAGGPKIVGVVSAGSTALKFGLSDRGVATGSNIARTLELARRQTEKDSTKIKALDRGALMREGLEKGKTAEEAAQAILPGLVSSPMSTPGNVEFVDSREAFIIEGSYSELAIEKVQNDIAARANRFKVLEALNQPTDVSSICRYVRCRQLLEANRGKVTMDMMVGWSMDHANGPGPNSICRHGSHFTEETSLAAAVMEIDPDNPAKSKIYMCLGKPCHAWRSEEAQVRLDMTMEEKDIPVGLRNGEIWKKYYTEEPKC